MKIIKPGIVPAKEPELYFVCPRCKTEFKCDCSECKTFVPYKYNRLKVGISFYNNCPTCEFCCQSDFMI